MKAGLVLAALQLVPACGNAKKSDSTADTSSTTEGSVTANTANSLAVAGTLNLDLGIRARLAGTEKGLILFTLDNYSKLASDPEEIELATDGSFTVNIDRNRLEKLKSIIVDGIVDKDKAKSAFPENANEIDVMSNAELIEALSEEIEKLQENPNMRYVLVSYDKSGKLEAEAASMQFIGLPTSGSSLKMLPGEALKGDLSLGLITGSGDEATSNLTAADSLDLAESVIQELAGASQTLKFLKNTWMNPGKVARVTPWFSYGNTDLASTVNKFTTPSGIAFNGGGYYIAPNDIGATWGETCPPNPTNSSDTTGTAYSATPTKAVEWYPPTDIVSTTAGQTFSTTNPYTNAGGSYKRASQYGEISCSKEVSTGGGMYTRAKNESDKEFQLQLGENLKGKTPGGIWRLKVAGTEKGRWDLSSAAPYDSDGDPIIYIPAIKVIVNDSGVATGFQAKFYFYDKTLAAFREVTDITGLKSAVNEFNMDGSYSLNHEGGDLSIKTITFNEGIVSGDIAAADQAVWPCPANSTSVQCISKLGFSYHIGSISYRMSLDPNGSP